MKRETTPTRAVGEGVAAVYVRLADLKPNPRNPRMHGPEVLTLARTILRTAWGAPIVAQARSRRIIGGHGRLEAAKEILAGIEVDGELRGGAEHYFDSDAPAPGMVPVRLVDVSDAEADAMMLADNAHALQGRDDGALIVEMAAGFGRESAMMADMGFDGAALDDGRELPIDFLPRPHERDGAGVERLEITRLRGCHGVAHAALRSIAMSQVERCTSPNSR